MMDGFWRTIAKLLMLCSIAALASCGNDRDLGEDEGVITPGGDGKNPPVITFDNDGSGVYTVKILKSITITPVVTNAVEPVVYTWKDEKGKIISTDPSYIYGNHDGEAKAEGEVYLKFRVDAKNGSVEEELRIDVVEKMIPSVSLIPVYSTYIGNRITIESSVNFKEDAKYEWTLNDKVVGTEENYTFEATDKGQFNLKLVVSNEDGEDNAVTSILVSDKPVMKITFENEQLTVPWGRAACVAPIITDASVNATYVWEIDNVVQQGETGPTLTFTPPEAKSYEVKVTGTDGNVVESASQTVICLQSSEAEHYRAPGANSSDSKITVYELMPAPGQFVGQIGGSTMTDACRYAENRINVSQDYISLGAWGGYIVIGLDHSIYNKPENSSGNKGGYDFSIIGNPFEGSSEPGIVYVMQDENGNGKPDDTWYELRGSETGKEETYQNYEVTYYRAPKGNMPLQWIDNRGNSGNIKLKPAFPGWVKGDSYTLRGTRLKRNTRLEDIWYNDAYPWGYADNWGEDILTEGDNHDAAPVGNAFKIENAMYPDGKPVELRYIDFIKVQTGIQSVAGALGELSTEVFGFIDYQMEKSPVTIK